MIEAKHYSAITEILDDMDGVNYAITEAQISGIRDLLEYIRTEYRNKMRNILVDAYEAGRKQDGYGYDQMFSKIGSGGYDSKML